MTDKEKRQRRRSDEDAVFNKMLLWLAGAVVFELLVLLVKRFYVEISGTDASIALLHGLQSFFGVYQFVGLALVILCAVWLFVWLKRGHSCTAPAICTAVAFGLWLISVLSYYLYDEGVRILMVVPAVAAVLILIYFLYHRAFFVNAVLTAGGLLALWIYRKYYGGHPLRVTVCFVLGWAVLILAALLAVRMSRTGGRLGGIQLMPEQTAYITVYLTCGITAAAMLLGLLLGSVVAYYLLFALVAWLFCQAVYFTVKLM